MSEAATAESPATDAATASISTFSGNEGAVRLTVGIDGGSRRLMVHDARHEGASDALTVRVLGKLCALIVGRPLQEAADHGAIYTAAALPDDCAAVTGIRTTRNAGRAFALAERLMRQVHAAACAHFNVEHRDNAWYLRPDTTWLAKDEAAQASSIKPIIADFLKSSGLQEEDIFVSRIERGTRVTIAFKESVSYKLKPQLMMGLERQLRRETGNPLELFMEEMKDANKIRRL